MRSAVIDTLAPTPEKSLNEACTVEINRYGRELYKFTSRDFKKLLGPGVYIAKTKLECLYVGSSKNIFGRTSEAKHEALRAALEVEGCEIWIITASSEAHARNMEAWLIAENQPRFNKAGKSKNASAYRPIAEAYQTFDEYGLAGIMKEFFGA